MSNLRAPDPTLTALPRHFVLEFISADVAGEPSEAHRMDSQHASGPMVSAGDARWFAVPCQECFPDAPERGWRPVGNAPGGGPVGWTEDPHLSWQVA